MAFHAQDGWFFRRNSDGSVTIALVSPPHGAMFLVDGADDNAIDSAAVRVTLPSTSWASVMASVSAKGETADRFTEAARFHDATGESTADELQRVYGELRRTYELLNSEREARDDGGK